MALTQAQESAVLAHLRQSADRAEAVVNAKTQGFFHGLISGDTGGGERTYVFTVKEVLIPALERGRGPALTDDAKATEWVGNAEYAERSLLQVEGYAASGSVGQILKDTVVQTSADVKDAAARVVVPLSFGAGFGIVIAVVVLAWLYLPHPQAMKAAA